MDTDSSDNIWHVMGNFGTPLILIALREMVCGKSGVLILHQKSMLLISAAVGFLITLARKINLLTALLCSATQTALVLVMPSCPIKTQRTSIARHLLATICVIIKRIEFNAICIKRIKHILISVGQIFSTLIHGACFKKRNNHVPQHN
jgi:hypothetical protein